jgi:hypothetical protein
LSRVLFLAQVRKSMNVHVQGLEALEVECWGEIEGEVGEVEGAMPESVVVIVVVVVFLTVVDFGDRLFGGCVFELQEGVAEARAATW